MTKAPSKVQSIVVHRPEDFEILVTDFLVTNPDYQLVSVAPILPPVNGALVFYLVAVRKDWA